MTEALRAAAIHRALAALYPDARCSLLHEGDPWRLLVMARLSAQCTDERVNLISKDLFRKFPTAAVMAEAPIEEIEEAVRSCGLFRGKARSIKEFSIILTEKYGGQVPSDMEELLSLPGVGRKIANLIRGDLYSLGGIVADTHCIRICGRLGFYPEGKKDPLFTERVMEKLLPTEEQSDFCHRMVLFGREWCMARSPRCGECPLRELCPKGEKIK